MRLLAGAWLLALLVAGCSESPDSAPADEPASPDFISLLDLWPQHQARGDGYLYGGRPLPLALFVRVGPVRQQAILASQETVVAFEDLTLPPQPQLHFNYGMSFAGPQMDPESVVFRVRVGAGEDAPELLWEQTVDIGRREGLEWQHAAVDLSGYAGQKIDLILETALPRGPGAGPLVPNWLPAWGYPEIRRQDAAPEKPNVVLISLDGLRADHAVKAHAPTIAALSGDGVRFTQAWSPSPWTQPAHMSLLSGKRPGALGFTNSYLRMEDRNAPTRHYAEALTLPKILADKGWRTAAFTGGDFLHGDYGFLYGFDTYGDTRIGPREARFTGEQAARWLAANHDQAFFLFVQSYQAQAPYQAPGARPGVQDDDTLRRWGSAWPLQHAVRSPTRAAVAPPAERPDLPDVTEDQRAQVRKLYASDVGEADALVARVLAALEESEVGNRTLVVVCSTHGEELWDHGGTLHGHTLYNELLHVPLVMRHPNVLPQGRTVERPVSLRHVAPTIVAALGLEMPDALGGQSLLPLMQGQEVDLPPVVAEAPFEGPWRRAVIADGWKLIRTAASDEDGAAQFELYDLATDPAEQVDRSASDEAQDLRLRLRGLLPPRPRTGDASPAK